MYYKLHLGRDNGFWWFSYYICAWQLWFALFEFVVCFTFENLAVNIIATLIQWTLSCDSLVKLSPAEASFIYRCILFFLLNLFSCCWHLLDVFLKKAGWTGDILSRGTTDGVTLFPTTFVSQGERKNVNIEYWVLSGLKRSRNATKKLI
jgi:hypothetical protein